MKTSAQGIGLIKRHEGLRLKAYRCPAGVWTIGFGHTRGVREGFVITEEEAGVFLKSDLRDAENIVNVALPCINQNQFDALVSFVFNVGSGNFLKSTLLKKAKVNTADAAIRQEFMKWRFADGKVLSGLEKRRKDEADLYFS